ncbi:restriction endonuclease subunit S [Pectinatus frisingensis]|uniref:restriction endonuclease subunit S n=1 Tax=Pectinatus frisingensis TaxID=865 RepID=UPI003D80A14A
MEKKAKVPKLRFPGFTDAWEQRKLGKLCDVYDGTHQTPNYKNSGMMFLSVENINSLKSEKYISENDFINDFNIFPEKGDVLMTRIGDIGTANVVESNEPIAYYVSLALLKKKSLDPYFLKESISSKTVKNDLWKRTLHIAFPKKINKNEIAEVLIPYPVKKEEQKQIGDFFQSLDNLITLHQRKLTHLQAKKKSLLQKMFPKKGECFPELRFPGFTDAWEQRKLEDGTSKIGDGLHGTPIYSENGTVFFVNGNNFVNGKIVFNDETKHVTELEQSIDDKSLDANTILMSINGTIGNLAYYNGEKIMLGKSAAYISIRDFDKKFLYVFLQTDLINQYFMSSLTGTTIKNLGLKTIRETIIQTPSIREQSQIGAFFSNLDNLITLHQRKLTHLQTQKKALLQQMFV